MFATRYQPKEFWWGFREGGVSKWLWSELFCSTFSWSFSHSFTCLTEDQNNRRYEHWPRTICSFHSYRLWHDLLAVAGPHCCGKLLKERRLDGTMISFCRWVPLPNVDTMRFKPEPLKLLESSWRLRESRNSLRSWKMAKMSPNPQMMIGNWLLALKYMRNWIRRRSSSQVSFLLNLASFSWKDLTLILDASTAPSNSPNTNVAEFDCAVPGSQPVELSWIWSPEWNWHRGEDISKWSSPTRSPSRFGSKLRYPVWEQIWSKTLLLSRSAGWLSDNSILW